VLREELVAPPEELVARLEELVAQREELVARREELVARREELVAPPEELVARLEELVARLEEQVAWREELVARREELVARPEELVARREELVARREELIARREELVARREELVARLEEMEALREELVARPEEQVARLEQLVARLEELVARPDELVARRGKLVARREELVAWREKLEARREELVARQGELVRELDAFWELTHVLKEERKLVLRLQLGPELKLAWKQEQEAHLLKYRLVRIMERLRSPEKMQLLKEEEQEQKRNVGRKISAVMKTLDNEEFKLGISRNTHKGFQNLIYEPRDILKMRLWQAGNQGRHVDHHRNPDHIISRFTEFTLTNDDLYFLYSSEGSLRALSLQTGTVLTSVSGCNLVYFTRERQVGYLLRSDTEERAILLTSLFNPFKFLRVSSVKPSYLGKYIGKIFHLSDTVLSVSSDSKITSWETTANKEDIPFICESFWKDWDLPRLHVKNCVLSSDGRLIAIHEKTKVELYSFADNTKNKTFLHSVYESQREFTVECFSFSADSTLLLFCIQDSRHGLYLYVWDVQKKVMAASRKSPGLLTIECCCFSWDKQFVILCGDYEIEILEYAKDTCRRLGVERPYHSVKFGQCTVSSDNRLLVCCIANRILIYNLLVPDINSSKQVLRGHLGTIEFCCFLKASRYLISYGVDGMVFLWDINELKAATFARITQGKEKILAMAVSPEEDLAVCSTSSDRVWIIKLCGLGAAPSLKPLTSPSKGKLGTAESSLQVPLQIASTSTEVDMLESSSSSDSEDDMNDYYQGHDDDVYVM